MTPPPSPEELLARQVASRVYLAGKECFPGPRGHCRIAAETMALLMREAGLDETFVITGDYDHPLSREDDGHSWVEWRGLIFDARAEQFDPSAPLVSPADNPNYTPWAETPEQKLEWGRDSTPADRDTLAESFCDFIAWNDPMHARSLLEFANALDQDVALIEKHLEQELDLSDEGPDVERWQTLQQFKAELDADIRPASISL